VLELERETTVPPVGAFPLSVTVAVEVPALTTLTGFQRQEGRRHGGRSPEGDLTGDAATRCRDRCGGDEATVFAVTVKVAVVALKATVTLAGTVATVRTGAGEGDHGAARRRRGVEPDGGRDGRRGEGARGRKREAAQGGRRRYV